MTEPNREFEQAMTKAKLYGKWTFVLERMAKNPEFLTGTEPEHKIQQTFDDIERWLLDNYYLIDPEMKDKWMKIRKWRDLYEQPETRQLLLDNIIDMHNIICKAYENITNQVPNAFRSSFPKTCIPINKEEENFRVEQETKGIYSKHDLLNESMNIKGLISQFKDKYDELLHSGIGRQLLACILTATTEIIY